MNDYLDYLQHHGIKGQKWGIRRFQNPDGSLTARGRKRQSSENESDRKKMSTKKKIAIGAAVTVGLLATTAIATTAVKDAASRKISSEGEEKAQQLMRLSKMMFDSADYHGARSDMFSSNLDRQHGYHYYTQAKAIQKAADRESVRVGTSFSRSAKYLWDSRKKK